MSNPIMFALKTDPAKLLGAMTTDELKELAGACVRLLERRGKEGDREAAPAMMSLIRALQEVEIH
ncbi:MAG: hypothetical protein OQJ99_02325 [Rhodospirillales bacterium]|nr:hypothetical protein [Rhodospirillales bacterium]MCW8861099.1 hypothetical protein [Rhodospirillales bacterium]MCW9003573.1 hypothetical protein [Rhodospirillales bacterium]